VSVDTATHLLETIPNLVGMKDSSGARENLAPLALARDKHGFSLFVGDDDLLLAALQAGWNGVFSGIACVVPELIVAVYRSYKAGNAVQARAYQATLDELIEQVVRLPIPWGVRVGLAARGIPNGPMHLPLSPERRGQVDDLGRWLNRWAEERSLTLPQVWANIP
jgi:dihydrodipicolinate synthase/N-acetylneuraminate lyase